MLDQCAHVDLDGIERQPAGLDFGEVENVVDQRHQRVT